MWYLGFRQLELIKLHGLPGESCHKQHVHCAPFLLGSCKGCSSHCQGKGKWWEGISDHSSSSSESFSVNAWPEQLRNIETIAQEYQVLMLFHSSHTARSCCMVSFYFLAAASVCCWLVCRVLDFFSHLWWFGQHSRTGTVPYLPNQTSPLESDPEFKTE